MKSYAFTRQRCLSVWACGIAISRRPAIKKSSCGWKKQHVASVMNPSKLSFYGKFGTKTDGFTDEGLVDHSSGDGAHDQSLPRQIRLNPGPVRFTRHMQLRFRAEAIPRDLLAHVLTCF